MNQFSGGGSGGRRGFRSLPLWLQWVLPFSVAAAAVLALVVFVNHETNGVPATAGINSPKAVAEQYREARIIVGQQQAPHVARMKAGQSPAVALRAAVVGYMNRQIDTGILDGPIKRASCHTVAGGTAARRLFRCAVTASAQVVTYPFDGVVQPAAGRITYCRRVTPPIPSMNVPVSRRCT